MYVFFGHHRCATTWTVTLIQALSRELDLRMAQEDRYEKLPADLEKIDFLTHGNATDGIVQLLAGKEYRAFHVIRDPRDILVSSYFSDKYSHYVYSQQFAQFRERLDTMAFDEGLHLELERRTAEFEAMAHWNYHNPRVYETRYEVLTTAPYVEFSKILSFLGIPMPETGMANRSARAKLAANKLLALLFDAHSRLLMIAHGERMHLQHWLINQAHRFLYLCVVDLNDQAPQKLVKVVFQTVFLGVPDLDCELHRRSNSNRM